MKRILVLIGLSLSLNICYAQNLNVEKVLKNRMKHIALYHVGIGIEGSSNENVTYGARAMLGVGSYRHWLNADLGVGFLLWNHLPQYKNDHISMAQIPVFVSANVNPIRWASGCCYVGGEIAVHIGLHNSTATLAPDRLGHDADALAHYVSTRGKVGVTLRHVDIAAFYEHDLSPLCNQKHMFESGNYDFDCMRSSLYEHNRIGISLTYNFKL